MSSPGSLRLLSAAWPLLRGSRRSRGSAHQCARAAIARPSTPRWVRQSRSCIRHRAGFPPSCAQQRVAPRFVRSSCSCSFRVRPCRPTTGSSEPPLSLWASPSAIGRRSLTRSVGQPGDALWFLWTPTKFPVRTRSGEFGAALGLSAFAPDFREIFCDVHLAAEFATVSVAVGASVFIRLTYIRLLACLRHSGSGGLPGYFATWVAAFPHSSRKALSSQ